MPRSALRLPPPRTPQRRCVPLVLGLVLGAACGEPPPDAQPYEDIARRSCAARFACECDEHEYLDEAECDEVTRSDLAALAAGAKGAGLTVDWTCVERGEYALRHGCATLGEIDEAEDASCEVCNYAHGDVDVGEPCDEFLSLGNCKQGLICQPTVEGKRCVDPCHPTEGSFCDTWNQCGVSMYCSETRCVPRIPIGEPCENFYTCVEGAYCGFDWTCVPLARLGEPCFRDDVCIGDTYCSADGVCVEPGGLGEPCTGHHTCVDDLYCDTVCVKPPAVGEPCVLSSCGRAGLCDPETDICVAEDPVVCR